MMMPPAEQLVGECRPESQGVCTDGANFHSNLAKLGKTNLTDPHQRNLLRWVRRYERVTPMDNPVFLYDVAQLRDKDLTRRVKFREDLQSFMGLKEPFGAEEIATNTTKPPRRKNPKLPKHIDLDICEPRYKDIREILVSIGKRASLWIRKYFLESDQVFVSNREYFEEILKEWKVDPCPR